MRQTALLLLIFLVSSCTKTVTEFTVKTKFTGKERVVVLAPEVSEKIKDKYVVEALSGSITANLGKRGFSYMIFWKDLPPVYGNFFPRLYSASRSIFKKDTNNIEKSVDGETHKDEFVTNLDLLGKRASEVLEKKGFAGWSPRYFLVSGIIHTGNTFSGSLKLHVYGVMIDRVSRNVVWGYSFDTRSGNNSDRLTHTAIEAGKVLANELLTWMNKSTSSKK
ncbi:MAG: hypothetical protein JXR95_13665 [Deltaproteobacteria bacterium]|nr:hypothetical protein [Deltaproteobacteria bacterium]